MTEKKFTLKDIDLNEVLATNNERVHKILIEFQNEIETKNPEFFINPDSNKISLFSIIFSFKVFKQKIIPFLTQKKPAENPGTISKEPYVNESTDRTNNEKIQALFVRITRFQTRYLGVKESLKLMANTKIEEKLISIQTLSKNKYINFNFEDSKFPITLTSTLNFIAKELITFDEILREILPVLLRIFNIPFSDKLLPHNVFHELYNLAPPGFQGIEPDIYYIISLSVFKNEVPDTLFSDIQSKQWSTYLTEINYLYHLISLNYDLPLSLKALTLNLSNTTINLPFKTFIISAPLSHNSFYRLIHVANIYVHNLWVYWIERVRIIAAGSKSLSQSGLKEVKEAKSKEVVPPSKNK